MEILLSQNFLIVLTLLSAISAVSLFVVNVLRYEREKEKETSAEFHEIIKDAQKQSREILEHSTAVSEQLIDSTRSTSGNIEQDMDRIMQKIAKDNISTLKEETEVFKKHFDEQLKTIRDQFSASAQQLTETGQNTLNDALDKFTQSLLSKTTESQQVIDKRTQELLTQVENDIAEYKKNKIDKLDEKISELLQKTFQDVLKRSIPDTLHKELILESLEKAKAEGVFNV